MRKILESSEDFLQVSAHNYLWRKRHSRNKSRRREWETSIVLLLTCKMHLYRKDCMLFGFQRGYCKATKSQEQRLNRRRDE